MTDKKLDQVVISFASELVHKLTTIVSNFVKVNKTQKLGMWKAFHECTFSEDYQQRWNTLSIALGIDISQVSTSVIIQHIARNMLEAMISKVIPADSGVITEIELSVVEEEAVRYSCGYVVRSLKKKFTKFPNCSHNIDILDSMYSLKDTDEMEEPDFLEYTKKWISKVDSGGLYHVNCTM